MVKGMKKSSKRTREVAIRRRRTMGLEMSQLYARKRWMEGGAWDTYQGT